MEYKLIVTDMDGTLLDNKSEISELNKVVLKNAYEKGINVAIATGRIYESAIKYAQELELDVPIICCNGAMIHNLKDDRLIYENTIDNEICNEIIDIVSKYNLFLQFYTNKELITDKLNDYAIEYQIHKDIGVVLNDNLKEEIKNRGILKVIIIDEENMGELEKLRKEMENIPQLEVTSSFFNNIEVMAKGVDKGEALKILANHLGIKREEIIAFGDNYNDLEMLKYAGVGVAVENAEEEVKSICDYVTSSNIEGGVAKAINKYFKML